MAKTLLAPDRSVWQKADQPPPVPVSGDDDNLDVGADEPRVELDADDAPAPADNEVSSVSTETTVLSDLPVGRTQPARPPLPPSPRPPDL